MVHAAARLCGLFCFSVYQVYQFALDVHIYLAVTSKGTTAFGVARQRPHKAGVLHLLVEVADECFAGRMCGGHLTEWTHNRLARLQVDDGHHAGDAHIGQHLSEVLVIVRHIEPGQDAIAQRGVFGQDADWCV